MAFFGLTTLGSQSPFELARETPLCVFEPSDWQDAFMQTYQPGFSLYSEGEDEALAAQQALTTATIAYDDLVTVLQRLYKCPKGVNNVPESASQLVLAAFTAYKSKPIPLATFMAMVVEIRQRSEDEESKAAQYAYMKDGMKSREFVSNLELRATLAKHRRMDRDPKDKALQPMTDSQSLGWQKPTSAVKRHPNISCAETKYASAMIKAGVYYY